MLFRLSLFSHQPMRAMPPNSPVDMPASRAKTGLCENGRTSFTGIWRLLPIVTQENSSIYRDLRSSRLKRIRAGRFEQLLGKTLERTEEPL